MSTTPFHPIVEQWFTERFGNPTEPQKRGWPAIASGRHTLIAAPTGSGKTLAAFLVCIDRLLRQAVDHELQDRIEVVYVSPLKALSNDIRRNLELPLEQISAAALNAGHLMSPIRAALRTGDTPAHERATMLKRPPHILVTTPESLYLLLTAGKSRKLLAGVNTVIVDEIHALARDKRGSHLMLTLERLAAICKKPPVRIGLSATQKPIDEIARFLVGTHNVAENGTPDCEIIDTGHVRQLDIDVEVPPSELQAICSNEQWDEIYKRLSEMINSHRSTVIFVNTRRMAERISYRLREVLGEDAVASHHGSLSREIRLKAEERLKNGELKAIVATASLELGIDIGFIDLVCQIGSPRSIATFLQRVGRAGHHLSAIPKGRLFALTRDELMEGLAILRAVRNGRLDRVIMPVAPLDILAQQIVAETAAQDWNENALYKLFLGAWPFRNLPRKEFNRILDILSEGIARGRREGAYLHRDRIHHEIKARKSARLTAITSGGAIPETADYRVVTEDEGTFVGTVNEDFAIESLAGDVFLLGNTSWRVRYVRGGQMVVRDAEGAPANIPFWLGEAPGRTDELSEELSNLREDISTWIEDPPSPDKPETEGAGIGSNFDAAISRLAQELRIEERVAAQAVAYVGAQKAAVGMVPTQKQILYERFFDDSGGMQLVIHAPFGSRVNRAWGLAMRKNFCRTFDFELQAAADDNGINLSLGPQHSFPLEQMFTLLKSATAEDALIQALLAAPMFGVRWRWNITRALAVLRYRGGKKVPPELQRFKSDDLMSAVFPLQTACFEHRPSEVPLPDHPLIAQTVDDCLHEAMDVENWKGILRRIEAGEIKLVARDTREPTPFSHAILNANPYSFLDDAPAEERRTRAVSMRRTLSTDDMRNLARLDNEAIERVVAEAQPVIRDPEELHDTLLSLNAVPAKEAATWLYHFNELVAQGRATEMRREGQPVLLIAAERYALVHAVLPEATMVPNLELPEELLTPADPEQSAAALVRGRLDISGPITVEKIAADLGLANSTVEIALARLEAEGYAMQGRYTSRSLRPNAPVEWCERRLLARIHRLTLDTARRAIQPVSPEQFWLYLAEYHHLIARSHREGALGLREAVAQLQGFEMPAGAWELDILGSRVEKYQPEWLDQLSYSGELVWGRLRPPTKDDHEEPAGAALTRVVPISLAFREDLPWLLPSERFRDTPEATHSHARVEAQSIYNVLKQQGALFLHDLVQLTGFLPTRIESALSELAALGLVTADGFGALRALAPVRRWQKIRRAHTGTPRGQAFNRGGRWTIFPGRITEAKREERANAWAIQLLRRYGIVFRDLLNRETVAPAWWEILSVYRRMEARGEIRGGRFVSGVAGEQYAMPEAVEALRRQRDAENSWLVISAVDPLNLTGGILPIDRVPALRGNRLLFHNGQLAATLQSGEVSFLKEYDLETRDKITRALRLTQLPQMREEILSELSAKVTK
jgi:ATP-dependent helicase Lhr and Lhr-like helicase